MQQLKIMLPALAVGAAIMSTAPLAGAETVLRLNEVAVGELDPAKATDYADSVLMFNAYDTLLLPEPGSGVLQPHLATSWEWDGNDVTFALRDDIKTHTGGNLTASDVKFSFDRTIALGQGFSHLFRDHVASVSVVDDTHVTFSLHNLYAPFLAALTRLPIVDEQAVRENLVDGDYGDLGDYGQAYLSANSAGSGAYKIAAHNPQDQTEFVKFADYFLGVPDAAPDKVLMRYGLEAATVRTLMSKGEHDITSQWMPPEIMSSLAGQDDMDLLTAPGGGGFYVKLNTQKPPLDDVHCRLALAHALDYETMIKLVAINDEVSAGSPANGPLSAGMMGYDDAAPLKRQDLDAAQAELAQCAYNPADHELELSWVAEVPLEERFALLMLDNFTKLGFKAKVVRVPWALFTERVTKTETAPHVSQVFVAAVTPDPDSLLYNMYHSSVAGTWQSVEWLNDEQVDALLDKGRTTVDADERAAIYRDVSARLNELAPTLFGYDRLDVFVGRTDVGIPKLNGASPQFPMSSLNFSFRFMEMN